MKLVNILLFSYDYLWTLTLIILLPLFPLGKKARLSDRLCLHLPHNKPKRKSIWIHTLSVGEFISALPIYHAIKKRHPSKSILFSVKTAQGIKIAKDRLENKNDLIVPMPLDFWWSVRRVSRYINPDILILIESDIWPGLINYLKRQGCKVLLINSRISPRTYNAYKRYSFFSKKILNFLDLFLTQSELDTKRLTDIGVASEKVITTGNIKFDTPWSPMQNEDRMYWLSELNFRLEDRIWVAGSCHAGEYEIIIEVYQRLLSSFPELCLILAPRNPETAGDISDFCSFKGIESFRRSDSRIINNNAKLLILDSIGELGRIYGLAEISFVGGSLVPIGGHNLLEPASFGRPVLFGPHTHNFVEMSEMLIRSGGGLRVKDGESLYKSMKKLLKERILADKMGRMAVKFVNTNRGALNRVLEYIENYI